MGFGDSFMDFAHGWNRFVSGVGHEIYGGGRYVWNGGSILDPDKQPSVDDAECLQGRIEGGQEYYDGQDLNASGRQLMGSGVAGMGGAIWDGVTGLFTSDPSGGGGAGGASGAPPMSDGAGGAGGASYGPADAGVPAGAPEAFEMWSD